MNVVARMMEDIFSADDQFTSTILNYDGLDESIVAADTAGSPEWIAETSLKLEQSNFEMDVSVEAWAHIDMATPPLSSGVPSPTQELEALEIDMHFTVQDDGTAVPANGSPLLKRRAGRKGASSKVAESVTPITLSAKGAAAAAAAAAAAGAAADMTLWNQMLVPGVPYTPPMSALTTPATSPLGSPRRVGSGSSSGGSYVEPRSFFPTLLINEDDAAAAAGGKAKKGSAKKTKKANAKAAKAAARAAAMLAAHAECKDAEEDEEIDVVSFEDVTPPTPAASPARTPERQTSVTSPAGVSLAESVAEAMRGVDDVPSDHLAAEKRALVAAVSADDDDDDLDNTPGSLKRKASAFFDAAESGGVLLDDVAGGGAMLPDGMPAPSPIPKRTRRSLVAELRAASPGMALDNEEEKRNIHNVLERKRRNDLKSSFELLKDRIPELLDNDRAPKVLILQKATEFIHALKGKDTQLEKTREELREENAALLERLRVAAADSTKQQPQPQEEEARK